MENFQVQNDSDLVSAETHAYAKLALLLGHVLRERKFKDIHQRLRSLSASRDSVKGDLKVLLRKCSPFAKQLNLCPKLLTLAVWQWSKEPDKGRQQYKGNANWLYLQPSFEQEWTDAREDLVRVTAEFQLASSPTLDPLEGVVVAVDKSKDIHTRLRKLEKAIRKEKGKRVKTLSNCTPRDVEIYFLFVVKREKTTGDKILGLMQDEYPVDLNNLDERRTNAKRAANQKKRVVKAFDLLVREHFNVENDD